MNVSVQKQGNSRNESQWSTAILKSSRPNVESPLTRCQSLFHFVLSVHSSPNYSCRVVFANTILSNILWVSVSFIEVYYTRERNNALKLLGGSRVDQKVP